MPSLTEEPLFQIFAQSFSDTLTSIGGLWEEKRLVDTLDSPENDTCGA